MEHVFDARATIRRGVVIAVNDTGPAQRVTVRSSAGAVYSDIEVIQPFGSANVPPVNGAIAVLLAIGGDPANMVALLSNPNRRMGAMAPGEQVIYGPGGSRVAVRRGGLVEILAATRVSIVARNVTITATAAVTLTAPVVEITGNLTVGTGATGVFTSTSGQTVTVQDGIITNIF